jgi:hypothetical protein
VRVSGENEGEGRKEEVHEALKSRKIRVGSGESSAWALILTVDTVPTCGKVDVACGHIVK